MTSIPVGTQPWDIAIAPHRTIPVTIDIKPGSDPNSVNPKSKGVIPVAILTTDAFDATAVDGSTVRFGPSEASPTHGIGHFEDVDGDGDTDWVGHFRTQVTGITCGDSSASLTGHTLGGQGFEGLWLTSFHGRAAADHRFPPHRNAVAQCYDVRVLKAINKSSSSCLLWEPNR